MKTLLLIAALAAASLHAQTPAPASPTDLRTLLRDALFEEEATRDLAKAAAGYESLLTKWGEQRQIAAAALFRLAEVRRKQDRKDDAIKLYQRLVAEFADQDPHARLSRENLAALGAREPAPAAPGAPVASDEEAVALARVQKLAVESPDLLAARELEDAAGKGWLSVVKFIVSKNVTGKGEGLWTASKNGHLAVVRELLTLKPPPEYLASAAEIAAENDRTTVLKLLLENGASPDGTSSASNPPLVRAIQRDSGLVVDLLLTHKAKVNPPDTEPSPLFAAARFGRAAGVERLLALGAKVTASGSSIPISTIQPMDKNSPRAANTNGNDPLADAVGSTPLHAAAWAGSSECVSLLLKAKADPNAANAPGWTPLHGAAAVGNTDIIQQLIAAGAKVDAVPAHTNNFAASSLYLAVGGEHPAAVAALLKAGANPNLEFNGHSPLNSAVANHAPPELLTLLLAAGADPTLGTRSAIAVAAGPLRIALLRSHQYAKLAAKPEITLVFGDEARESVVAPRRTADEKPAPLPSLLLAWHDRGGWNATGSMEIAPDWSALRLFRKGDGGKMTETVLPVKAGAEFPALQWGDVLEVVSKDAAPTSSPPSRSGNPRAPRRVVPGLGGGLPPEVVALLRDTQSARIKFTANGVTRDLTLRGHLRTWNPLSNEAPLVPLSVLAGWCAGQHPAAAWGKEVTLRRSGESGGGEARYLLTDLTLASILPRDGDEITLLEPEKAPSFESAPGIGFSSPEQQFGGILLPQDGTTLFRLLAILYAAPPPGAWPAEVFAADGTVADPAALPARLDPSLRFRVLPHPDLSKIWLHRIGDPTASHVDLLAIAAALPATATPEHAREFDIPLLGGSVVSIPTLPDTSTPWTGLPENVERLLILAHAARVTFDTAGNLRSAELRWHPARYINTTAGLLPVPAPGIVPEGTFRLPALTVGESVRAVMGSRLNVTRVIRPGVKENRGAMDASAVGWLTDGDQVTLQDPSKATPNPLATPRPVQMGQAPPPRPPAANTTRLP